MVYNLAVKVQHEYNVRVMDVRLRDGSTEEFLFTWRSFLVFFGRLVKVWIITVVPQLNGLIIFIEM